MGKTFSLKNSGGKIFYGIHFYPGVAQYQNEEDGSSYRVFLNEDTLRSMDPSFAGKPVFVEHVDEVTSNLDKLKKEADGWVIESFFNSADGKHWVKFIVVSREAEKSIQNGLKLSNAYIPNPASYRPGGLWNGVPYEKEITAAEYEHLAIVKSPRYEESIIMTPDEFKKYNEEKISELKKISNSQKGEKMKFNFFKRTKVENFDPEISVVLPKSGKAVLISKLINDADEKMDLKSEGGSDTDASKAMAKKNKEEVETDKNSGLADLSHKVKMHDGSYCNVGELLEKHKAMADELESMKKDSKETELDLDLEEAPVDAEGDLHNVDEKNPEDVVHDDHEAEVLEEEDQAELNDDDAMMEDSEDPSEDESAKKKALQLAEHEEKEIEEAKKKNIKKKNTLELAKKAQAKEKADRLKNAHLRAYQNDQSENVIEISDDRVARGKRLYGSNN